MGELQKLAGPDQRVTARAVILEEPSGGAFLPNRNWLGVWKTTYASGGQEWPLIGKAPDNHGGPYPYVGIYSDLRETEASLNEAKWKSSLLQGWLVSRNAATTVPSNPLDDKDEGVIELLGRGTLGDGYNDADFGKHRVLVEKITVKSDGKNGTYAWYVSDNNQKASISLDPDFAGDDQISFLAMQVDNLTSVESPSGTKPYANYGDSAQGSYGKLITDRSAGMIGSSPAQRKMYQNELSAHFHHFTTHGSGLFVDVTLGGFKKDLAPLLFGLPNQEIITFASPSPSVASHDFSSDYPIIAGPRHAVLGPSFGALRYWGRMKSLDGLASGKIKAQVEHKDSSSTRVRPAAEWPHGISDGLTFDGGQWASKAPKIHPIMTDVRWHYYFSHTEDEGAGSFRTHLIPRVCLWNPYNVSLQSPQMIVLLPNPYWEGNNVFHFNFEAPTSEPDDDSEVSRLKNKYAGVEGTEAVAAWGYDGRYKIGARGSKDDEGRAGLFPDSRYLGFVTEVCEMAPGECLVFSPKVNRADYSSDGVDIQQYNSANMADNVLSARGPQGEGHFFHDYETPWIELQCTTEAGNQSWRKCPIDPDVFGEMKLSQIVRYQPAWKFTDNFPFVLKSINGPVNLTAESITSGGGNRYPTLQLMNHGNGGVKTHEYSAASSWGPCDGDPSSGFSELATFAESPRRDAPALHQVGAKLLWLDESGTEANAPPLRQSKYGADWTSDHWAFHPASIAQWNVRPGLITRSPSSPCAENWYAVSCGAWMLQFSPYSPQSNEDMASLNTEGEYFSKSPFAASNRFWGVRNTVLFDLPDVNYGALSMGALRHAQLSPYSWHPSYIVSHSLADIHAPYETSAHLSQAGPYLGSKPSGWDAVTGGEKRMSPDYGPKSEPADSTGLLQIGNKATQKSIDGAVLSSQHEVLAYDIAYEVNLNLWDQYFFSGIPIGDAVFTWKPSQNEKLWNMRYQEHSYLLSHREQVEKRLTSNDDGSSLTYGFWHNAYLLKNRAAFNVNSTSVQAWCAFLSGLQGVARKTTDGTSGGDLQSVFARVLRPQSSVMSGETGVENKGGWGGGRILTESEIHALAAAMVRQVKSRGPFVSLADFVNRRLAPKSDASSRNGALDQAISDLGLNRGYQNKLIDQTRKENRNDHNHTDWRVDLDKQPASKAWGIPGFLTQGDILEPLAPAMTVRGDSFLIRCYGEARDQQDRVMSVAYLEAVIMRSPEYVVATPVHTIGALGSSGDSAITPALMIDPATGAISESGLSEVNQLFGRKFFIETMRWLSPAEV